MTATLDRPTSDHERIHSSASAEWFTPGIYIEAAREVMGGIDLDPASCAEANLTVKADAYFTEADDGLSRVFWGRVYLNSPYGRRDGKSNQALWSEYLIGQYKHGFVQQAIMLVNAQTAEKWFRPLWQFPICFTDHRIRFISPTGQKDQPTHGNAFVYMGQNTELFARVFSEFGPIVLSAYRASGQERRGQ